MGGLDSRLLIAGAQPLARCQAGPRGLRRGLLNADHAVPSPALRRNSGADGWSGPGQVLFSPIVVPLRERRKRPMEKTFAADRQGLGPQGACTV
jgi:hypothetical protein